MPTPCGVNHLLGLVSFLKFCRFRKNKIQRTLQRICLYFFSQPIGIICFKGLYICSAANLSIISETAKKKAEIFQFPPLLYYNDSVLFLLPLSPIGFSKILLYLFTKRNKIVFYNIFNLSLIYLIIIVNEYMSHLLNDSPRS